MQKVYLSQILNINTLHFLNLIRDKYKPMEVNVRKLFASFVVLLGMTTTAAQGQNSIAESRVSSATESQGDFYKPSQAVAAKLSRITIYRATQGYIAGVIRVRVNGQYHTSLQLGGFTDLCLSAVDRVIISSGLVVKGDNAKTNIDISTLELNLVHDNFVRVVEAGNGRVLINVVSAHAALVDLQQTRRQVHAASRVDGAQSCDSEFVAQPVAVITRQDQYRRTIAFAKRALNSFV